MYSNYQHDPAKWTKIHGSAVHWNRHLPRRGLLQQNSRVSKVPESVFTLASCVIEMPTAALFIRAQKINYYDNLKILQKFWSELSHTHQSKVVRNSFNTTASQKVESIINIKADMLGKLPPSKMIRKYVTKYLTWLKHTSFVTLRINVNEYK